MSTAEPTVSDAPGPDECDEMAPHAPVSPPDEDQLTETELLVEDVSIDGMCGVY